MAATTQARACASLMVKHGHPAVAAAFIRSRIRGEHGVAFGTLLADVDMGAIIERSTPKLA